ncbi:MAG: hypothetical protein IIW40_05415 [Clostridia bacterium]|nr:hypothetical protein [Clostridia bacterium]
MNEQRLMQVFGDIDDEFVAEAARPKNHIPWPRIVAVAAAVALTVGLSLLPWDEFTNHKVQTHEVDKNTQEDKSEEADILIDIDPTDSTTAGGAYTTTKNACKTEIGTVPDTSEDTNDDTTEGSYILPQWGELTLTRKYPEVSWQDVTYTVNSPTIPAAAIGEPLAKATAYGHDVYTSADYQIAVTLYRIKGVAEQCAVAVVYDRFEGYYPAYNVWYRPETLGQFLDDLNLKENIKFGKAYMDYFDKDMNYHSLETKTAIAKGDVFNLLLSDTTLENVYDQQNMYVNKMSLSVNVPLLGIQNVSLGVTEEGYLFTNILGSGKAFFIGKDKAQAFIDHVTSAYSTIDTVQVAATAETGAGRKNTTARSAVTPGYNPSKGK